MVVQGSNVKVVEGSKTHGLRKGDRGVVLEVREDGPEYGHTVSLRLDFGGKRHTFTVRHRNRLDDNEFNGHKGDPTQSVRFTSL